MENDTKYIASCSFGKDSMASIILARENNEPLDTIVYAKIMFDNDRGISAEPPEHELFINNVATPKLESWGYEVVTVQSPIDYLQCFHKIVTKSKVSKRIGKKRGFPLCGRCVINRDCKVRPLERYVRELGCLAVTEYVGIAIDEPQRLTRLRNKGGVSLLEKYSYTEQMAAEKCSEYRLLSPIYEFTDRSGCWFCPNSKDSQLKHLQDNHPELWHELVELGEDENLISPLFNRTETIQQIDERLRKTAENGKEHYEKNI